MAFVALLIYYNELTIAKVDAKDLCIVPRKLRPSKKAKERRRQAARGRQRGTSETMTTSKEH
jgi:hypothetical protein